MTEGSSAAHQKTVHQLVSRLLRNKVPSENRYACSPRKRYSSVVNVVKAISIPETVLRDDDVFVILPKNADEYAPAFDGDVDGDAAAKALADACVGPFDTD